jgi:predicted Zn finger-like uncharacterized protein
MGTLRFERIPLLWGETAMPLQNACSACSTKIKVKDELVGKAIKCPKCGKVFKALADGATKDAAIKAATAALTAASPARKPAATKPPAAWDDGDDDEDAKTKKKPVKKGPPKKRVAADEDEDDDEDEKGEDSAFEDLLAQTTLSPESKKRVNSELGLREKGLWVGQPDPKIMTVRSIRKAFAGVFFFAILAVFGSIASGTQLDDKSLAKLLIGGIVVAWLVLSFVIAVMVMFMEHRRAVGSAYVITNKRCITLIPGWFTAPAPVSYYPDLVQQMRRIPSWIFGGDSGDIVFRSVTTITRTYSRRHGTSTSVQTTHYGFLGIRQLDEVEGRIRQALLSSDDDDDDDDRRKKNKKKNKKRDDEDD